MKNDPDSSARLIHSPKTQPVRAKKSSWWKCFPAAFGVSLFAVALLWIIAALTVGVPFPMAGYDMRGVARLGDALVALFFYMLLLPPIPLAIALISAVSTGIGVRRYPIEPVKARRMAMLCAFLAALFIWGVTLPWLLRFLHES